MDMQEYVDMDISVKTFNQTFYWIKLVKRCSILKYKSKNSNKSKK